jgi:hypothetical protein
MIKTKGKEVPWYNSIVLAREVFPTWEARAKLISNSQIS